MSPSMHSRPTRLAAPRCIDELMVRAAALEGRTVGEVAAHVGLRLPEESRRAKGHVGQAAELILGADPQAGERPDFTDLGVELKTVPITARGAPKESTFCCSIDLRAADTAEWESSRLRQRLACVLWLPVDASEVAALPQRRFGVPVLWRPSEAEEAALREDWELLMGTIGAGQGGALTAHAGEALQVRPKAADASVRTLGPAPDGAMMTLPLGFYLRTRFTRAILDRAGANASAV